MNLGARTKQRRQELGLSIRALAEEVGISHSAINMMEKRDYVSSKYSAELADALGVRVEWLISGEEPMISPKTVTTEAFFDEMPKADFISVNYLDDYQSEVYPIDRVSKLTNDFSALRVLKAHGDSMLSAIGDGDIVLIDTSVKTVINNKIYAIKLGDETLFKRLFKTYNGGLDVVSENSAYDKISIPAEDMRYVEIIGVAIYREGKLN